MWTAVAGAALLVALLALAGCWLVLRRQRRRTDDALADAAIEQQALLERIVRLEETSPVTPPTAPAEPTEPTTVPVPVSGVVVTGGPRPAEVDPVDAVDAVDPGAFDPARARIDGRLFADLVVRESVVKAASLAHGLRHALAPATRNRIRFEMKREVKRSRRARKDELKVALREFRARQRARIDDEDAA